jgi:hypothetical protein
MPDWPTAESSFAMDTSLPSTQTDLWEALPPGLGAPSERSRSSPRNSADPQLIHPAELRVDGCTWYRNVPEGVKTLAAYRVDGAARGHNKEREGTEGLAGMSKGSIGQMAVVEVAGEVGHLPVPQMGAFETEVGLERPSEVVHGRLQFGRNHQWIWIDHLRSVSRTERV